MEAISILLGDDQVLVRAALAAALDAESGFKVVASASEGREALDVILRVRPRVALLASRLPGRTPLDMADALRSLGSPTSVILLGGRGDEAWARFALEGPLAGYVSCDETIEGVVAAIRLVATGGRFVSASARVRAETEAMGVHGLFEPVPPVDRLSLREKEVLLQLARGLSVKEVAGVLSISRKTVDNHAQRLMAKLDIHTRAGLVRFAIREHLMSA